MDFGSFVLAASTADLADATEPAARTHADAVEFRMDRADTPLEALAAYDGDLPVIATNRVDWEGGDAPDGPERIATLEQAAEYDAVAAVDIELEALRKGGNLAIPSETAQIVSVHDFEGTPAPSEQRALLTAALDRGDVGKLAVTATDPEDVPGLLSVTREFAKAGKAVATMAMGEPGRHTRVVTPIYGSRIGYAPVDPERATAPGQYTLETMATLIDHLSPR